MARKKNNKTNIDVVFIILLIASIISAIIIYLKTGYIGEVISPIIGGIVGNIKYGIPIGIFFLAIATVTEEKKPYTSKIIQYIVIIAILSALLTILEISKGTFEIDGNLTKIVFSSYDLGKGGITGGVVGTTIAVLAIKLFGLTGAAIILGVLVFILIFTTYAGSPTIYLKDKIDERKEIKEERYKEREKAREKRAKEREKKREELRKQKEKEELEGQLRLNLESNIQTDEKETSCFKRLKRLFGKKQDMGVDTDSHHIEEIPESNLLQKEEESLEENIKSATIDIDVSDGALEYFGVTEEDKAYNPPSISMLQKGKPVSVVASKRMIANTASKIQKTLYSFGVTAKVEDVAIGPAVTRYELIPAEGVRVNKIASLSDDIALNLAAESIRIEAPIPGKRAVGIEVPNEIREMVNLRDVIESEEFSKAESKIAFALGKATSGEYIIADIAKMPHVLIAGSTGSGKSVCINTIINSIVYNAKPSEVKLILVDPKVVELSVYNNLPHLATTQIVTEPKMALGVLNKALVEMTRRFTMFAEVSAKNIDSFNQKSTEKIPYIIVIIDELADLMMTAAKEVEAAICRIAQMGRAAGIHLVVATQRPSVDVITGLIKANMPTRIAFAVTSQVDSRTILDQGGAEKLLGRGDMLYYPMGATRPLRVQGAFISEKEINDIMKNIGRDEPPESAKKLSNSLQREIFNEEKEISFDKEEEDDLKVIPNETIFKIIDLFIEQGRASINSIENYFNMGNKKASRAMRQIEEMGGIISSHQGTKARTIEISKHDWEIRKQEILEKENNNGNN